MNDLWFVFSTMGEMTMKEILAECQSNGWIPILHFRSKDGKVTVPCFRDQETAMKFARRNLPKKQIFGSTNLPEDDMNKLKREWIEGKGWNLELMNFPKSIKDRSEINVEIFEYSEKPDVYAVWGKQAKNEKPISVLTDTN
jgi:hypothetical protein